MIPPVIWRPSPNHWPGPSGYPTLGIVNHRIVGTAQYLIGDPASRFLRNDPINGASSHFVIGYLNGILVIVQCVDLVDSPWTNGDVRDPSWSNIIPGVNPNLYTLTIEHEDGGAPNGGIVTDEVWEASIELQSILVSGDPARFAAAGIQVRDPSVIAELAAIPKDETGFIDHHQISGPNKPYCWRPWMADPGFVHGIGDEPSRRDRLLAALRAPTPEPSREERLAVEVIALRAKHPDAAAHWARSVATQANDGQPLTREMRLAGEALYLREVDR